MGYSNKGVLIETGERHHCGKGLDSTFMTGGLLRLLLLLSLLTTACGGHLATSDSTQSIIDGSWVSACWPNASGQSYRMELAFSFGARFLWQENHFEDPNCSLEAFALMYEGSYELEVTWQDFLHKLDLRVRFGEINPVSKNWVEHAREQKFCGYPNWQLNIATPLHEDLFQISCPGVVGENFIHRNLVKIKDGFIWLAIRMQRDNGRPEELPGSAVVLSKIK